MKILKSSQDLAPGEENFVKAHQSSKGDQTSKELRYLLFTKIQQMVLDKYCLTTENLQQDRDLSNLQLTCSDHQSDPGPEIRMIKVYFLSKAGRMELVCSVGSSFPYDAPI